MYLMEKNGAQMNVPPDKLDAHLQDGWKVLKTPEQNRQPVAVETAVVESEAIVLEGTAKASAKKSSKKE